MQLVQGYAFRLYSIPGCPHCEAAKKYFDDRDIPIQLVVVDKLLEQGIIKSLRTPVLETPIIMNYRTGELTIGYKEEVYARWIEDYLIYFGASSSDSIGSSRVDIRPPQELVENMA